MNAIEIKNVSKSFGDFEIKNLSLNVPTGSVVGLIGRNGAGKTTTINLIMNAINADNGTISVLGTDNRSKSFISVKEDIGVVLDEALFPELLNAEQLNKVMSFTYKNWDKAIFNGYINSFGLPPKKIVSGYSRGMKMKLAIAVALSHSPKLLILDEATGGLDPVVRDEILDLFCEFTKADDHTILISSHIISDLEKICDYIAFIDNGRLVFCEEKDRLYEKYGILHCDKSTAMALPKGAIVGSKETEFSSQYLVKLQELPTGIKADRAGIEDIILLMSKGGHQ